MADPDDGFVVIYEFPDDDSAQAGGQSMADYLGSSFGQTNYPADAQFFVTRVGQTVVFTSWSRRRSDDPARAEAAFDALAPVGQAIEVRK